MIENPDGSASFELVNGPGQFLNLKGEKDWTIFRIVSHTDALCSGIVAYFEAWISSTPGLA